MNHYIWSESFSKAAIIEDDFLELLYDFSILIEHILEHKESIWVDDSFYEIKLFNDLLMEEFLYNPNLSCDAQWLLLKTTELFKSSIETDFSSQQIFENIIQETPVKDTTLLHLCKDQNNPLFVNDIITWRDAHKFFLMYCFDNEQFITRASKCFNNLYFHERTVESLKTLTMPLSTQYNKEIIEHLTALNEELPSIYSEYHKEGDQAMLERLSIEASPERKPKVVTEKLTFNFKDCLGNQEPVKCGPHTKLSGKYITSSKEYLFDRIYFSWAKETIQEGKILIAHIGKHRE